MKDLSNITEYQVKRICELAGEPYESFLAGRWENKYSEGLKVQILTTCTLSGNADDSFLRIYSDGKVTLTRNNGDWGGLRDISINALPITDYLRSQGYEFKT